VPFLVPFWASKKGLAEGTQNKKTIYHLRQSNPYTKEQNFHSNQDRNLPNDTTAAQTTIQRSFVPQEDPAIRRDMQGQKPGLYLAIRPKTMQGKTVFIMPQALSSKDCLRWLPCPALAGARCPFLPAPTSAAEFGGSFLLSITAHYIREANKKIKSSS
jgi:hypothetical protein